MTTDETPAGGDVRTPGGPPGRTPPPAVVGLAVLAGVQG